MIIGGYPDLRHLYIKWLFVWSIKTIKLCGSNLILILLRFEILHVYNEYCKNNGFFVINDHDDLYDDTSEIVSK